MTRLLTAKDIRRSVIDTHLIAFNTYDIDEVDRLLDDAADSIDALYKENVRLSKECAALENTIRVLEADLSFIKYANLNNPVKEETNGTDN